MDTQTQKKYELVEFQNLKQNISKEVVEKFLESSNHHLFKVASKNREHRNRRNRNDKN